MHITWFLNKGGGHTLTCGSAVFILKGIFFLIRGLETSKTNILSYYLLKLLHKQRKRIVFPIFQKSDLPEMPAPHFFKNFNIYIFFGKVFTSRILYKNFKLISLKKRRSACEGRIPPLIEIWKSSPEILFFSRFM